MDVNVCSVDYYKIVIYLRIVNYISKWLVYSFSDYCGDLWNWNIVIRGFGLFVILWDFVFIDVFFWILVEYGM